MPVTAEIDWQSQFKSDRQTLASTGRENGRVYPGTRYGKTVCFAKFEQNEGIADQLKNTGSRLLVEASGDKFWAGGMDVGRLRTSFRGDPNFMVPGANVMGKILMAVRSALQSGCSRSETIVVGDSIVGPLKTVANVPYSIISIPGSRAAGVLHAAIAICSPLVKNIVVLAGTNDLQADPPGGNGPRRNRDGTPLRNNPSSVVRKYFQAIDLLLQNTSNVKVWLVEILPRPRDIGHKYGREVQSSLQKAVMLVNDGLVAKVNQLSKPERSRVCLIRAHHHFMDDSGPIKRYFANGGRDNHLSSTGARVLVNIIAASVHSSQQ